MDAYPTPPSIPTVTLSAASSLRHLPSRPELLHLMRGVYYRPTESAEVWRQKHEISLARCRGAWETRRSAVALSHESAALVHGLWVRDAEPDVWTAMPRRSSPAVIALPPLDFRRGRTPRPAQAGGGSRVVSMRRRRLVIPEESLVVVQGIVVTDILRTAVDCAFDLPACRSVTIIDSAMRALVRPDRRDPVGAGRRWAQTRARFLDAVEAEGPRRGAVRAGAVARIASPFSESPGESVVRWQVDALGLPSAVLQQRVDLPEHRRSFFLDLAWPDLRVAAEYDGRDKYAATGTVWEEKVRQDLIQGASDWSFSRFTAEHLRDASRLREDVLAMFPAAVVAQARRRRGLWD
ncbi:hypothetical protein [Actinomyces howellii]|uniref:Transcriptional regulator, AbiEi antitoxin, Type IV TA system n=1 Tax=Actinomyces howellii TaxID=52771 RepID=A0A448HFK8_9ACTO|nr:hypothetical protein [Actinomyces howellii]VEG27191.1 Uncharacterised protein [Actinomyces howellii]